MSKYRELVRMAMDKGFEEETWDLADDMVAQLCKRCPELYNEFMEDLEHIAYKITAEEAERIVRAMRPKGQYWSMSQIKEYLSTKGIDTKCVSWYLVMNMMYNDYCDTAKLYGLSGDTEFFFSLSKDFINDPDAKPHKVEKYFLD